MNKKLIIIIAAVLLLAVAAGLYFFVFSKKGEDEEAVVPYYYALKDAFVTNVKDSGKLFKATIILVTNKKGMDEYVTTNLYLIRDKILFTLRSLTEEELSSQTIQEDLRERIPALLNEALGVDNFISLVFSDFVMQ